MRQLGHENIDHIFFRVNPETGVKETTPVVCTIGRQFAMQSPFSANGKPQAKSPINCQGCVPIVWMDKTVV